jgi:O-antigen/teichoic acid export membrane protein
MDESVMLPLRENQPINSNVVIRRAARASTALIVRQVLVYGANILGSVMLARILPPDQFGFYGIVLFAIAFLGIFGGTGFAANLIRNSDEPSTEEMRVVFTAQQLMVGILFIVLWFAAPFLSSLYRMPEYGRWFFRMIGGALVMTSFMVMPQILMERELAFDKLAVVEVSQAITFNMSAVFLAWKGLGPLSFSASLMLRAAVGAILAYRSEPWKMGLMWHPPTLFRHVHFGIQLQAGQFVGMLKDSISPLFVGMFLGTREVGYVTWATSLTAYAVWILMPLQRLYMPLFARLQTDREQLRRVVTFALWMSNAIVAPLTIITLVLSRPITILIFGQKWLVALPLYYIFCFGNLFVPCATPLLGALNALGQSRKTLVMSVIWMVTTWLFGVPCIILFGLNGFGIAMIGVQLTNLVLFWMVWRVLSVSPFPTYWPSWPIAGGIGILLLLLQFVLPVHSVPMLTGYAVAGFIVYGTVLWFGYPQQVGMVLKVLGRRPA